jgi:hypothetical protein
LLFVALVALVALVAFVTYVADVLMEQRRQARKSVGGPRRSELQLPHLDVAAPVLKAGTSTNTSH